MSRCQYGHLYYCKNDAKPTLVTLTLSLKYTLYTIHESIILLIKILDKLNVKVKFCCWHEGQHNGAVYGVIIDLNINL